MAAEVGEKAPYFTLPADGPENWGALEEYTKVAVALEGPDGTL